MDIKTIGVIVGSLAAGAFAGSQLDKRQKRKIKRAAMKQRKRARKQMDDIRQEAKLKGEKLKENVDEWRK